MGGGWGSIHDEFFNSHEHSFPTRCAKFIWQRIFVGLIRSGESDPELFGIDYEDLAAITW
jgi:hypothetical protein